MFLDKYMKYLLVGILLMLSSCQFFDSSTPDVSDIEVDLVVKRFDNDLFTIDTTKGLTELQEKYPDFLPFFTKTLMEWPDSSVNREINTFVSHPDIRGIWDTSTLIYSNFKTYEEKLVMAFKHYKYHFPTTPIPEIVTYISAFRQLAFTIDNRIIGIGLDMHLGKDYVHYPTTGYPEYIVNTFEPDHLTSHAMKVWAQQLYPESLKHSRFIDRIIYEGQLLYFLDMVLPDVPDHIKIGYTKEGWEWCQDNEKQIWSFFIEKKMLYESESRKYVEYISNGPTSSGMPQASPGNVGSWLGWQIVRKYMEAHPEEDIQDLWQIRDGQEVLKLGKYKP